MNKNLKKGGIVAIFTVIVIAAVIVVNLIAGTVPAKYRRLDLSTNQIFSLSGTTKDLLGGLTKDVNIYIVGDPDRVDERITHFAGLYADLSDHVTVEVKDPVLHPDVLSTLNTEANTVLPRHRQDAIDSIYGYYPNRFNGLLPVSAVQGIFL